MVNDKHKNTLPLCLIEEVFMQEDLKVKLGFKRLHKNTNIYFDNINTQDLLKDTFMASLYRQRYKNSSSYLHLRKMFRNVTKFIQTKHCYLENIRIKENAQTSGEM